MVYHRVRKTPTHPYVAMMKDVLQRKQNILLAINIVNAAQPIPTAKYLDPGTIYVSKLVV